MSVTGADKVVFDIRRSTRWLFDDDLRDMHLVMPIVAIGMGVALLFLFTLPAILAISSGISEDLLIGILMAIIPFIVIRMGYGLLVSEGREAKYLRLTTERLQIPETNWGFLKPSRTEYIDVPLDDLKDVSLASAFWGKALVIKFIDADGKDQKYELAYSSDGPGYEADIYGLMEALERVHPDGPQPTADEFMTSLKQPEPGKKAPANAYIRHDPDGTNLIIFPLLYFTMFVMLLFYTDIGSFTGNVFIFIMFVPTMSMMYLILIPMLMIMMLDQHKAFLDRLVKDFRIANDEAIIPTPLMARAVITRRSRVPIDEIKEVRLHLVQKPLSNLAAVEMADGTTFLVSDEVFHELVDHPSFLRDGRRLTNRSTISYPGPPVARIRWTFVRIILLLPLLISIALAVSELATLL